MLRLFGPLCPNPRAAVGFGTYPAERSVLVRGRAGAAFALVRMAFVR